MAGRKQDSELKVLRNVIDKRIKINERNKAPRVIGHTSQVLQRLTHENIDGGVFGDNQSPGMVGKAGNVTVFVDTGLTVITITPTLITRKALVAISPIFIMDNYESNFLMIGISNAVGGGGISTVNFLSWNKFSVD